jgi:S-DNA-T family DNA segregation ATPase FtsK/SpoIIIE
MANPEDFDWDRHEAEILDLDAARAGRPPTPVDSPDALAPARWSVAALRPAKRLPIVPTWARSRTELLTQARWVVGFYTHASVYHLTRFPKYTLKLLIRAPRGAFRFVSSTAWWVTDGEGAPVRAAAVRRKNAEEYLKLSRQRDARVRLRTVILLMLGTLGLGGVLFLVVVTPQACSFAALVVVVALLGLVGAPADRPLLDTAVSVTRALRLASDVVLGAVGVAGIN